MLDKLLEKTGLKYEDLNAVERETLNTWAESLAKNRISVDGVKNHIAAMRDSVEQELAKTSHNSKQDMFLKARLRNYMLLESYLSTPDKAKQAIERALSGMVSKK